MSNLLTNSRLRTNRDCRRKHRLMYLEGWRPVHEGEALSFGKLVHTGLEAWWKDDGTGRLAAALGAIAGRGREPHQQVAAEEVLTGYDARWLAATADIEVLAVETTFVIPLINPETCAPSRTWNLAGKLDGVLRRRATGETLILEHKTTTENIADPTDPYWTKLAMDPQVSHYFLGAEGLGWPATGCCYDVLLRPRLKPLKATPPEARKYTKDGRLYASQREVDETPEEYRARVRADIAAEPAKYFQRRDVPRTEADIRDYLGDVWAEGRAMREAELAGRAPRSPEACHRFGQCPFWEVCTTGLRPEDHSDLFEHLDDVHPELELELTEAF